ncbi:unnamed protein product [Calicophoron daubneyi]|uniref:Mitochondria-eating protein n=1 Tax=Calicophoron daubneyi TaxID=300641 RepID=A0AAV2T4Q6_CALDB
MAYIVTERHIQQTADILEHMRQWRSSSVNMTTAQNTSFCCSMMEETASLQHELFKILHQLVHRGALRIAEKQTQRARSTSPCSQSFVRGQNLSFSQSLNGINQNVPSTTYTQPSMIQSESKQSDADLLNMLVQSHNECDVLARKLKEQIRKQDIIMQNTSRYYTDPAGDQYPHRGNGLNRRYDYGQAVVPKTHSYYHEQPEGEYINRSLSSTPVTQPRMSREPMVVDMMRDEMNSRNPGAQLHLWLSPLVGRYNDIFTNKRTQTVELLQSRGPADYERSQRVVFYTVQVCFAITRQLLRRLYPALNARQQTGFNGQNDLSPYPEQGSFGDVPLGAQHLNTLVRACLRRLVRRPPPACACRMQSEQNFEQFERRSLVPRDPLSETELGCLSDLIREVCSLAWYLLSERQARASYPSDNGTNNVSLRVWHVDVDRSAKPGDTYDDKCYRKSFDSDAAAGLVHHYIWPCLLLFSRASYPSYSGNNQYASGYALRPEGLRSTELTACVLAKGEACTRHPGYAASHRDRAAALLNGEYPTPTRRPRSTTTATRRRCIAPRSRSMQRI